MVETAEKKPDAQTDVKDRDEGAPTGSLTSKLALGPTPYACACGKPACPTTCKRTGSYRRADSTCPNVWRTD